MALRKISGSRPAPVSAGTRMPPDIRYFSANGTFLFSLLYPAEKMRTNLIHIPLALMGIGFPCHSLYGSVPVEVPCCQEKGDSGNDFAFYYLPCGLPFCIAAEETLGPLPD